MKKDSLASAMRQGGYILYFRHAQTDWSQVDRVSDENDWWSCDPAEMRQLSDEGRDVAANIGAAMKRLLIPIGAVYASEYCRARETAEQFDLQEVQPSREIMNLRAASFLGGREKVIERAKAALQTRPSPGTNTVWVAHGNIVRAATGEYPGEAGCIVFHHGDDGVLQVVGQLAPGQWLRLVGLAD